MKTSDCIKLTVWLVLSILILNLGFNMLSAADTLANIIGLVIIIAVIFISFKTNCLRTLKFRKYEK